MKWKFTSWKWLIAYGVILYLLFFGYQFTSECGLVIGATTTQTRRDSK